MKRVSFLFYLILLFSCNQNIQTQKEPKTQKSKSKYAIELIGNNFLKYADSSKIEILTSRLKDSFDIYDEDNFKIVFIDAEELAEFNFDFFLPDLKRILEKRQFNLEVKKLYANDNSLNITINQDTIQLYSQKDLDNNLFWDKASRNFFNKVNEILKEKNIEEQFYLLYGGNDLHTLLLTDRQFLIISEYYEGYNNEKPYKP